MPGATPVELAQNATAPVPGNPAVTMTPSTFANARNVEIDPESTSVVDAPGITQEPSNEAATTAFSTNASGGVNITFEIEKLEKVSGFARDLQGEQLKLINGTSEMDA